MPAYISHAIMGEQLYKECKREGIISNVEIQAEELRGYSLGNDLATLSKNLKANPHNFYTQDFFLIMIQYIKENRLSENSTIMALLYGHMAHYFLDINTHPFIFYIEKGCKSVGKISPHHLVEGYLDSYLADEILNKSIMDIKASYFNQIDLSDTNASCLLNSVYGKVYGDYNIIKTYKRVMFIFSTMEKTIRSGLIPYDIVVSLSKFNKFLDENNLNLEDLNNEICNIYKNPVTGETSTKSFLESYKKSIEMSLEAIKIVNKVLYDNYSNNNLENVFTNLSYDTGVNCSLGKKFIYTRNKHNGYK